MAGKPKLKAAFAALEARGGVEQFKQDLLSGKTIPTIAKELGIDKGYLRKNLLKHEVYSAALAEIADAMADAHADAAFEMFQELKDRREVEIKQAQANDGTRDVSEGNVSQVDIGIARNLATQHNFIAASYNKSRYGTGPQANVTINIGDLHLDALRKVKVVENE